MVYAMMFPGKGEHGRGQKSGSKTQRNLEFSSESVRQARTILQLGTDDLDRGEAGCGSQG